MSKQYIVFWHNSSRIGSIKKTNKSIKQAEKLFPNKSIIQTDITGTEHWNLFITAEQLKKAINKLK